MSDAQEWSELARGNTATMPAEPVATQGAMPGMVDGPAPPAAPAPDAAAPTEKKRGLFRRKAKEPKAAQPPKEQAPKAAKAPKAPKAPKAKAERSLKAHDGHSLLSLNDDLPNRQQLEQEAAAELTAAIAPSLEILRHEVPDAPSPEDAYRKIESQLDAPVSDRDAGVPDHPIYSGDALVYYQLRRHYGSPNPGGTYHRSWYPGQG